MIPFIDFGGRGPLLHFAHANGYPARAYQPLIDRLTAHYHVISMVMRPMWPEARPTDLRGWEPMVADLLQFAAEHGGPMIGAGHSLGAVVTLAAALREPGLFRALVLIDPVLFGRRMLWALNVSRRLGVADRLNPLVAPALRRRRLFASAEEMFNRYRKANVFKRIDDSGLRAYVDALASPRPDGQVELAITPEWEARIYEQGPLDLWNGLKDLQPPALFIRGAETDTFLPRAAERVQRSLPGAAVRDVAGTGHLVPLEKPDEVAALMEDFLTQKLEPPKPT